MAKAKATSDEVKQVFVVQPGVYAGRIMTMRASHADAALADGWGVEVGTAIPPNESPAPFVGDMAQSYKDWIEDAFTPDEPAPPLVAPTVASLNPNTAESGDPTDVTMVVTGTGFTEASVIIFNGFDEPTTLISDTQCSTIVKPSLFVVPAVCPVQVRDAGGTSNSVDFTFTAVQEPEE